MINLNKEQQAQYDKVMSKISLAKDKQALGGYVVNLSKCMVDLSKKSKVDLCGAVARVVVVLDYSGSMDSLYRDGTIQRTLNRLVPLGLSFDDNGELDVYLFQNNYRKFENMTLNNYANYKEKVIDRSGYSMGGTHYAPVLRAILNETGNMTEVRQPGLRGLFGAKQTVTSSSGEITFVIFITDGESSDADDTKKVVVDSAKTNTFIQFIGIGNAQFRLLRSLDDLPGREIDNTGFTNLNNLAKVSDSELYETILEQFADWLKIKK